MNLIPISLLCIALAGCAAPYAPQAKQLMSQGNCNGARQIILANESDPSDREGLIGATYADCDKNMPEAFKHWTIAARYGNQLARDTLARFNRPIPSPDLAQGQSNYSSPALGVLNSTIEGRTAARSQALSNPWPSPPTINCVSRDTSMGQGMNGAVFTTCR